MERKNGGSRVWSDDKELIVALNWPNNRKQIAWRKRPPSQVVDVTDLDADGS